MNPNTINDGLNIIDRIVALTDKISFLKLLKIILYLWLIVFSLTITFSPSTLFDKYQKWSKYKHSEKIENRKIMSPLLQIEVERILLRTGATRGFLLENHNGTSNSIGIPFFFSSMNYEAVKGVKFISDYYRDFSLSKYPFFTYVANNNEFYGNTNAVSEIDNRLAGEMRLNNSQYIAIAKLPNNIGFFGITYADEGNVCLDKDKRELDYCLDKIIKIFEKYE